MERWLGTKEEMGENGKIDAFLNDVVDICKKHGFSLAHEDTHGAFEVHLYDEQNIAWLMAATDRT